MWTLQEAGSTERTLGPWRYALEGNKGIRDPGLVLCLLAPCPQRSSSALATHSCHDVLLAPGPEQWGPEPPTRELAQTFALGSPPDLSMVLPTGRFAGDGLLPSMSSHSPLTPSQGVAPSFVSNLPPRLDSPSVPMGVEEPSHKQSRMNI